MRVVHQGALSIRLERSGRRTICFDPIHPPSKDDLVVLTGTWPEHLRATAQAVEQGRTPTVVAPAPVLDWLASRGALVARPSLADVDGVGVELRPYTPIPYAAGLEALRKLRSVMLRPDRAARRVLSHVGLPSAPPQVARLTLPEGGSFVHLSLALHGGTPSGWLDTVVADWGGADWLLAGVDHGEDQAWRALAPRFPARWLLVADLLSQVRRSVGMPTSPLSLLVDQLRADGLDAYVLPALSAQRFSAGIAQ